MAKQRKPSPATEQPSEAPPSRPAPPTKLTEGELKDQLARVPEWSEVSEAIQRTYHFKNFREAMAFVDKVADAAEDDQHHPDILVRYNKVTLTLSTHDSGGITAKDFALAAKCDGFYRA